METYRDNGQRALESGMTAAQNQKLRKAIKLGRNV